MTKTNVWHLAVGVVVAAVALRGQDADDVPTRLERLVGNLHQLNLLVSVDRTSVYFPGETAAITVTLTNPTASPLEILDPRAPGMASFALSMQGGPFTKDKAEWSQVEPPKPPLTELDPSTVIQPGQSITLTFHPEDKSVRPWIPYNSMPLHPGNYRLRFRLGGEVEFQVGAPVLEASAVVSLQEFKTYQEDGMAEPETVQEAAVIVAVRLNDGHLLFTTLNNVNTTYKIKAEKDGTLEARGGEPWLRLLAVPSKVTSLSGTADPSGQITLQYTLEGGGGGKVYLDKNRRPL